MRYSNYKKSLIKTNLKSHWLFYIPLIIGICVFMEIGGVYATTTISDSSINVSGIINSTADIFSQSTLNLTIPYYLTTNNTFVSTNSIWTTLSNGTLALNNGTFASWLGLGNGTMITASILNNGTYATWLAVGNGTFSLASEPKAYNGTLVSWLGLTNGTVALQNTTWVSWNGVSNGTIALSTTLNNGSYFAWGNLGNGTYASWNQLGNGTMVKWSQATNGTLVNNATAGPWQIGSSTNISISNALNITSIGSAALPTCNAPFEGLISRNSSGLYYCNTTMWATIATG